MFRDAMKRLSSGSDQKQAGDEYTITVQWSSETNHHGYHYVWEILKDDKFIASSWGASSSERQAFKAARKYLKDILERQRLSETPPKKMKVRI